MKSFARAGIASALFLCLAACASRQPESYGIRAVADGYVGGHVGEMVAAFGPPTRVRAVNPTRRVLRWDVGGSSGVCVVTAEVGRFDRIDLVQTYDDSVGSGACEGGAGVVDVAVWSGAERISSKKKDEGRVYCNFSDQ